jgi:hypothetical protein
MSAGESTSAVDKITDAVKMRALRTLPDPPCAGIGILRQETQSPTSALRIEALQRVRHTTRLPSRTAIVKAKHATTPYHNSQ